MPASPSLHHGPTSESTPPAEIARRILEQVISTGDVRLADELIAEAFVIHDGRTPPGREGFKQALTALRAAFPDWTSTPVDLVAHGDRVAGRWTVRGTHSGPFMGLPATGKQITMNEAGVMRFERGQLVEIWRVADELSLLQQLGVLPPLPGPSPQH